MASTINSNTSSGVVVTSDTSGVLQLQTAGTTAVTINASQQVGIGTSSPTTNLQIGDASVSSANKITLGKTTSTTEATLPTVYAGSLIVPAASVDLVLEAGSSSGGIAIRTAGSTRAVVDSVGNLGLGVTPSAWRSGDVALDIGSVVSLVSAQSANTRLYNNTYVASSGTNTYKTSSFASYYDQGSGVHRWFNAPSGTAGNAITFTQAMTLDASGNLLVGTTSTSPSTLGIKFAMGSGGTIRVANNGSDDGIDYYNTVAGAYRFYIDAAGTIHATSTTITAISDASLKTNIKPLETGLAQVLALQPRRFDWTEESKNEARNVAGFIAQEVQAVLPDLVGPFKYNETETKLGLKMGDMIPTLVKAIQELSAQVTELKAEVALLKGV